LVIRSKDTHLYLYVKTTFRLDAWKTTMSRTELHQQNMETVLSTSTLFYIWSNSVSVAISLWSGRPEDDYRQGQRF